MFNVTDPINCNFCNIKFVVISGLFYTYYFNASYMSEKAVKDEVCQIEEHVASQNK